MSTNNVAVSRANENARIAENRERNAMITAIRGTIWSKDLSEGQMRSIAQYCHKNALDPIRHIEVLGGRIYLTATLYEERAVPLIQQGLLVPHEPQFINNDARLDELAAEGDQWAKDEIVNRKRLRIEHNAPEKADAIVIYRITVAATGKTVVGVNWCGKGLRVESKEVWAYDAGSGKRKPTGKFEDKDMDPVGGNEPAKTAITRAGRRAWKQVAQAVPTWGEHFAHLSSEAELIGDAIVEEVAQEMQLVQSQPKPRAIAAPAQGDEYGNGDLPAVSPERIAQNVARHAEDARTLGYGEERSNAATTAVPA